jgi:hypothetical protein
MLASVPRHCIPTRAVSPTRARSQIGLHGLPVGFTVGFDSSLGAANGINCDSPIAISDSQFMSSAHRIVRLSSWLVVLLLLPGCNTLNPLCGSARPAPILNSISPATMVFSELPASFDIIATGSHFVSSSVVIFNGATLATAVDNHSQLTATITSSMIPAPGTFNVLVKTPAGNTGDLGCSSGGTSRGQVLTVN